MIPFSSVRPNKRIFQSNIRRHWRVFNKRYSQSHSFSSHLSLYAYLHACRFGDDVVVYCCCCLLSLPVQCSFGRLFVCASAYASNVAVFLSFSHPLNYTRNIVSDNTLEFCIYSSSIVRAVSMDRTTVRWLFEISFILYLMHTQATREIFFSLMFIIQNKNVSPNKNLCLSLSISCWLCCCWCCRVFAVEMWSNSL